MSIYPDKETPLLCTLLTRKEKEGVAIENLLILEVKNLNRMVSSFFRCQTRTSGCLFSGRQRFLWTISAFFLLFSNGSAFAVPQRTSDRNMSLRREPFALLKTGRKRGGSFSTASSTKLQYSPMIPLLDLSNPFWKANGIYAACNAVGFAISLATGSHVHLDLIGTGAFALAAVPALVQQNAPMHAQWSSYAVAIWGTKLASFLFFRATQVGHDKRLEDLLSTPAGTFQFWFITMVWNVLCSMPYLLGLSSASSGIFAGGGVNFLRAGGLIYSVGLGIETLADFQKWFFKRANPGTFCDVGLWGISQHPNYFGNLVLWFGILVMNVPWLIESVSTPPLLLTSNGGIGNVFCTCVNWVWRCRRLIVALVSPWFMWTLFSSQASGAMTNSVSLANSKFGNVPAYEKYVSEVPLIIPKFW